MLWTFSELEDTGTLQGTRQPCATHPTCFQSRHSRLRKSGSKSRQPINSDRGMRKTLCITYIVANGVHETFSTLDSGSSTKPGPWNGDLELVCVQGLLQFFNDSLGNLCDALSIRTLDQNTSQDSVGIRKVDRGDGCKWAGRRVH